MKYTLQNIRKRSFEDNPVKYSKIISGEKWHTHKLENAFKVLLSNGKTVFFFQGWTWDLASVPQWLWWLIRPFGDDDIAYLIHDWLYQNKTTSRKFADKEMYRWAKAMKQTNKISLRNVDIWLRYIAVRAFGWIVWNKK